MIETQLRRSPQLSISHSTIVLVVALAGFFLSTICWYYWHSALITDDGVQYLSTAANWLWGNGLSTNALIYDPHFQGKLPAPQTVWTPGFPLLVALSGSVGFELATAALLLNLCLNALSAIFFYLILKRCAIKSTFAAISASLFYFTAFPWYFAAAIMSEPLFTCLVLASIYCLPNPDDPRLRCWIFSGVLLAASIATRYSGVFVAASFGMGLYCLFVYQSRMHDKFRITHKLTGLLLCLMFPVATFGLLILRTRMLSGSSERRTGVIEAKSAFDTLWQYFEQASVLTGFKDGLLFTGDVDTWMFFIFLGVCLCISIAFFTRRCEVPTKATVESVITFRSTTVAVLLAHIITFSAYLIYSSLTDTALSITYRYLYQIYPAVFIIMCLIIATVLEKTLPQQAATAFRFLLSILILTFALAQINMISGFRDHYQRGVDSKELVNLELLNGSTVSKVVESCVGIPVSAEKTTQASLWSNEGVLLQLNTGVNTISLPPTYASTGFDSERFKSAIETYQIKLFVFIKTAENTQGKYGEILVDIEQWLTEGKYSLLQLTDNRLKSGATVDIYAIHNECYL